MSGDFREGPVVIFLKDTAVEAHRSLMQTKAIDPQ
jgi:hypothetical protein